MAAPALFRGRFSFNHKRRFLSIIPGFSVIAVLRSLPTPCRSDARFPPSVVLMRGFPLSVILRSFAPKNLSGHVFETGEKILRCAQNDRGASPSLSF